MRGILFSADRYPRNRGIIMKNRLMPVIVTALVILTAVLIPCGAAADDDSPAVEKSYTDITHEMSYEQRESLSRYLCRFGACYTTEFEGERGGKIVLDTANWDHYMSEIIWWQFLAYSKTDRENPNAPIYGQTKTVTPEQLRQCVKNTFDLDYTPYDVISVADEYYIDHTDGNFHPPQQDPSGTMWTRSPESCKIQYLAELEDGTYIVQYIPEYLESATGMHNGSIYYAKLRRAATESGYTAREIGTVSSLDSELMDMGFLEDAEKGSQAISNISIDYERTHEYETIDEYKTYLSEILDTLGENSPTGPAVNQIAAYITSACLRNSKTELEAENNTVVLTAEVIRDSMAAAEATSDELWQTASERGIKPNKDIVIPVQLIVRNLNDESAPIVVFDESLIDGCGRISNLRVLLGDNSHGIIMDVPTCRLLIETYGTFSIDMGMSIGGGYIINFYNSSNELINKLPVKVNFAIPASNEYDSVYNTNDGRDFNIGGIFDEQNRALEFKTNTPGLYKVKNNTPDISDISGLSEEEQRHIMQLVSKDYFTATGGNFRPDDQYTNFDAARAVAGMLFTVDTDARLDYSDVDEADPQSVYVASIEEANIQLYSEQGGLRFNGNSAVGLEDSFTMSLELLVNYKGYYLPDMGDDPDRPYESIFLNYPDIQYMKESSLGKLALGAREGIINDGMALTNTENRFDRKSAAEFLYRLFERMCEVAPASFDAGDSGYRSSSSFYNPLSTMSFDPPPVVYIYLGCFAAGILFAAVLYIMEKKNKIVNETAEDAGGEEDYWNEY